jgi:hypothetical protein
MQEAYIQGEENNSPSPHPLSRVHAFRCLRNFVGGHALCPEIHHHVFCIVAPMDPINTITPTSMQARRSDADAGESVAQ